MTAKRVAKLHVDLTEQCPLTCAHCSNSSGPSRTRFLPFARVEEIVREAAELGTRDLTLSGGEPLLYPQLVEVLGVARRLNFAITLFTTGVIDLISRQPMDASAWRQLHAAGLKTACFSIYADPLGRHFHNELVRLKPSTSDAFAVNEAAIRYARRAGLEVQVQFVPSTQTAHMLLGIHRWAAALGCSELHLQVPTFQGRNADGAGLFITETAERVLRERAELIAGEAVPKLHVSRLWRARWWNPEEPDTEELQIVVRSDGIASLCNACKYICVPLQAYNLLAPNASLKAFLARMQELGSACTGACEDSLAVNNVSEREGESHCRGECVSAL